MKHTKGPWRRFGGMVDGYGITSDKAVILPRDGFNGLHHDANARLIASAPDLLEACKSVRVMLSVWSIDPYKSPNTLLTLVEGLDKAIQKAEV